MPGRNRIKPGQVALVTGSSGGLGQQLLLELVLAGCLVAGIDVAVPERARQLRSVLYVQCDITDSDAIVQALNKIHRQLGRIAILINNAAISTPSPLEEIQPDQFRREIEVNLYAAFLMIKCCLPDLQASKQSYIVNIASVLGYMCPVYLGGYGASKAGLIALHESISQEIKFSNKSISMLLVVPGQIKTSLFCNIKSPHAWLAPSLEAEKVARAIVRAMKRGSRGALHLPSYARWMPLVRAASSPLQNHLRNVSGMNRAVVRSLPDLRGL